MSDEIIYLEPDEEITSVIDKLKNAKSARIALVVPKEATLLQSVVNLKLLVKEAVILKKEISLVTADKIGRNLASQVGLAVYDTIRDRRPIFQPSPPSARDQEIIEIDMTKEQAPAEDIKPKGVDVHHFQEEPRPNKLPTSPIVTPWQKEPKKEFDWRKLRKIFWPVLGIIIILIFIVSFLTLPKATVKIKVKAVNFQKDLSVGVNANATQEDLDQKIFPGNLVDISAEKEEKFTSTGKKNLGGKATGTLTLYNYWDSNPQAIDKGTKFSSSDKTFLGKSSVTIPGTSIRGGNIVPGTASIDIEAENPGEDYNIKAGRFTIVGLAAAQQEKIYGQSSKDLTGGFSKEVTVVSQTDYDQAKDSLVKALQEDLQNQLKEKSAGMEILDKAKVFDVTNIQSSANVDAETTDFTMKVNERLRTMVFDRAAFNKFVLQILEKQISYDQMLTLGPNDSIDPKNIDPKYDDKILNLDLVVSAKISTKVDTQKIQNDLLGKSRTTAESYLNNLNGLDGYEINFSPKFWLKRIPNFGKALKVELEYVEESPPQPSPLPEVSQ